MITPGFVAILLLVLNGLVALVYGVMALVSKENRKRYCIQMCVTLICPVVAPLYLALTSVLYRLFFSKKVDRAMVSFDRLRSKHLSMPLVEEEMNLVPLTEALAVSHKSDQRRLLMQVLKRDSSELLGMVRVALESTDSETSHYAASAILDMTARFEVETERLLHRIREDPVGLEKNRQCAETIYSFLCQNVLPDLEEKNYVYLAEGVYENLYQYHRKDMEAVWYREITDLLLKVEDFLQADKWSRRAMDELPDSLEAYRARLKTLYAMGEKKAFFACLQELKESDIRVDEQILDMIRFLN